jgi:hypothetical protein
MRLALLPKRPPRDADAAAKHVWMWASATPLGPWPRLEAIGGSCAGSHGRRRCREFAAPEQMRALRLTMLAGAPALCRRRCHGGDESAPVGMVRACVRGPWPAEFAAHARHSRTCRPRRPRRERTAQCDQGSTATRTKGSPARWLQPRRRSPLSSSPPNETQAGCTRMPSIVGTPLET